MEIYETPKSDLNAVAKKSGKMKFLVRALLLIFLLWTLHQTLLTFQASKMFYEEWSKAYVYGYVHMTVRCIYMFFMLLSLKYLRIGCLMAVLSSILIAAVELWFSMPYSSIITSWWYFPVVSVIFYCSHCGCERGFNMRLW